MLLRSIVEQLSVLIKNKPYQKYENVRTQYFNFLIIKTKGSLNQ